MSLIDFYWDVTLYKQVFTYKVSYYTPIILVEDGTETIRPRCFERLKGEYYSLHLLSRVYFPKVMESWMIVVILSYLHLDLIWDEKY